MSGSAQPRAEVPPAQTGGGDPIALAIIILNYRTPRMTADCIDSLQSEVRPGVQVIVVDNASGDGSADMLEQHVRERGFSGWVRVVRSPVNGGFSAGNNLGIRAVFAHAYVLLNSDTLVRPGALSELCRVLDEQPEVGVIGPSFEDGDGRALESCFPCLPHPLSELVRAANTGLIASALQRYHVVPILSEQPCEPLWMPFACVVIRRAVIDAIGLLDEGFFMYFEDVDYCIRARAAGFKLSYWPRSRVVHLVGKSSNVTAKEAARRRAPPYYYAARSRYFAKHFGHRGLWLANTSWVAGRAVSKMRELLVPTYGAVREREWLDIWIHAAQPLRAPSAAEQA